MLNNVRAMRNKSGLVDAAETMTSKNERAANLLDQYADVQQFTR